MLHRFGPYEIDEPARTLRLDGTAQDIQPRVLDLLIYLVQNAGRVVPKGELMDALWPDLTVTEASLQRAVSLARRALAPGGLSGAIRSFVRHGYRFAIDEPSLGAIAPTQETWHSGIGTARELAQMRDWDGAAEHFARAAETGDLLPDDVDLWAFSVESRGWPAAALPMWARAVEAHIAAGEPEKAARAAATHAKIQLERGSAAAAMGWLDRAEALLVGVEGGASRAYLLWMKARMASVGGRAEEALDLATEAQALAEEVGDAGLRALTLAYLGFFNIALGNVEKGADLQNHAAAIALSSRIDPISGCLVYCNILWSCRTFADWQRAMQWSEGFEAWSDASFARRSGACDLHRAEVLGAQRTLPEALAKIESALSKLGDEEDWSLGEAYRVRGDIHAMIGNIAEAKADYAMAYSVGWDAEPGNAVLLFEGGDLDGALSALDRALQGLTWFHLQRRGMLLVHRARIAALGGRKDLAREILTEIEMTPDRWPQPAVRALLSETKAALLGDDDPESNRHLLLARQLWTSAQSEYQAARLRTDLVRRFIAFGDLQGAATELAAAERTAIRLGSRRLMEGLAPFKAHLADGKPQRPAMRTVA